ncbi:hypothetical protein TVAG_499470 [Trichomonas vaginalis G3]|uniref:RSE1/DDB1/CPSF1 second beta-propeller domain-containing protein n=1 Tax=Trichomonas vaginalis (strain ATCC PRA-98 / G3) TaxID=412133 RepID=A2EIN4_TRIV3|nr:DNA repair/RNA processing CPSF family [Trichomonas vaginalis G3]EAY07461.1 hypothetical protein TVAG_499470 [Trichomonas vaginalis G3]KAI5487843.1 DNA repair/RNA processing CPSF family [Trichomonas vaginalis G3]|eukprot:XP_001319684.1 hypothetical protein [Trichomonas vaginalis G3]
MNIVHRSLQHDTIIQGMCILNNANNGRPALAVAQGSTLHIMDPVNLEILDSYPFKTPIALITAFSGRNPEIFILLRNLNWFIFQLPELTKYESITKQGLILATRRILPISSPFELGSTGSNPRITESIRLKEKQFAYATHPDYIALSIFSGLIHIIPRNKPMFAVPVTYTNIVDLAFMGPTVVSARLAILTDSKTNNRELHVCKIVGTELLEEFDLPLPPDAYSIIPLHPEVEASLMISTSDGIHRITAPIGLPLKCEHLSTFVSTISISATHLIDDLYLILDAEGCICAASFPVEGRPRMERLLQTKAVAGSIIYMNNSIIVSSPFTDLISYSFDRDESSCRMEIQATFPISGPVRSISINDDSIYISNDSIRLFEKTIQCRTAFKMDIGNCLSLFSSNQYICLSYLNSSVILSVDDKGFEMANPEHFISNKNTVFFGESKSGPIQVTNKEVSILSQNSMSFNFEITAACCQNDVCILCYGKEFVAIEIPSFKQLHYKEVDSQILLVYTDSAETCILTMSKNLTIYDDFFNVTFSTNLDTIYGFTSIEMMKNKNNENSVYLGTTEGKLVVVNNRGVSFESIGENSVVLKPNLSQGGFVCSGKPPTLISSKERVFLGTDPCTDIVCVGDNFVSLNRNELKLLNSESPSGSSKPILTIDNIVNSAIMHEDKTMIPIYVVRIGDTTIKTYKNMKENEEFVALHSISLMEVIKVGEKEYLLVGTDDNDVFLLDSSLSLVCKRTMESLPTAACFVMDFIIIANRTYIEQFTLKENGSDSELERIATARSFALTTALNVCYNRFVVVADSNQSISILDCTRRLAETHRISYCHGVSTIGVSNNGQFIFAADYNSVIHIYGLYEFGVLEPIGVFQTDSRVISFAKFGKNALYGTEGGGIGLFTMRDDFMEVKRVSQRIDDAGLTFIDNRIPDVNFLWPQQDCIIDADNILIALNMPDILEAAGTTKERIKGLLKQIS